METVNRKDNTFFPAFQNYTKIRIVTKSIKKFLETRFYKNLLKSSELDDKSNVVLAKVNHQRRMVHIPWENHEFVGTDHVQV